MRIRRIKSAGQTAISRGSATAVPNLAQRAFIEPLNCQLSLLNWEAKKVVSVQQLNRLVSANFPLLVNLVSVIEKVRVFQSEIAMGRKVKSFACIVWLCILCVVAFAYKCCIALRHFCISILDLHTPEKYKAPNPLLCKSSSMASPSNPRKRTKEAASVGRHIDTRGHL